MQAPVTAEEARVRRHRLQQRVVSDGFDRFALSSTIALTSTLVALPLHRIKHMAQCVPEYQLNRKPIRFNGGFGAAMHLWKNEGITKYWRGISPAFLFAAPVVFGSQLATLNFAHDVNNSPSIGGSLARGYTVAGITAAVSTFANVFDMAYIKMATDLRYPESFQGDSKETSTNTKTPQNLTQSTTPSTQQPSIDPKQKQKLITYSPYHYRNWLYTAKRTYTVNGSKAFFHAVSPLFAFHFAHYTSLFSFAALFGFTGMDQTVPLASTILTSALTTLIIHPFDTIRTRMLYRLPTDSNYRIKPYKGMYECAKYIWDHEGIKGYTRGSGAALGIFLSTLAVNGFCTSVVNSYKRDRLQREYLYKMQQYAQEERAQALEQSRTELSQLQLQNQRWKQSAEREGRGD